MMFQLLFFRPGFYFPHVGKTSTLGIPSQRRVGLKITISGRDGSLKIAVMAYSYQARARVTGGGRCLRHLNLLL